MPIIPYLKENSIHIVQSRKRVANKLESCVLYIRDVYAKHNITMGNNHEIYQ